MVKIKEILSLLILCLLCQYLVISPVYSSVAVPISLFFIYFYLAFYFSLVTLLVHLLFSTFVDETEA